MPALAAAFGFAVAKASGLRSRRFPRRCSGALGRRGRGRHLRSGRLSARERAGQRPAAGQGGERARADRPGRGAVERTASTRCRSPTSSRCAAIHLTGFPVRPAWAPKTAAGILAQYGIAGGGARGGPLRRDRGRAAAVPAGRDDGRRRHRCRSSAKRSPSGPPRRASRANSGSTGLPGGFRSVSERGAHQPPAVRRASSDGWSPGVAGADPGAARALRVRGVRAGS